MYTKENSIISGKSPLSPHLLWGHRSTRKQSPPAKVWTKVDMAPREKKSCWYKNLNAVPHLLERKMRRILPFYVELLLGARRNFMRARLLHLLLSAWIPIPFFCSIHQKCGRVERAERICFSFQFQRDSAARRDGGEISSLLLQLLNFSLGTTTTTYYSGGGRAGAKRIWKLWFSPLLTLLPENEFMAWLESTLIPNGISAIFFTCQLVGL